MARMADVPLVAIDPRRRRGIDIVFVVAGVVMVDAEHALDAADHATDRAADDGADRSGAAVAFIKTMRGAAGNALRMRRRSGEDCKNRADDRYAKFHELPLC